LHDGKKIVKSIRFPLDEEEIADRLARIKRGEILEEEREIVRGESGIITNDPRLSKIAKYHPGEITIDEESFDTLRRASIILAERETSASLSGEDLQIIQMIRTLDELQSFSNVLSARLSDWKKLTFQDEAIENIAEMKERTGSSIELLERRIEESMKRIAPNLSEIAEPLIGARLIALSGGLKKLASMPASTIQIMGAEKALFRYKSGEGSPPKHGIIYMHPLIRRTRRKGKAARIISTMIATAAKADAFTKRYIANELRERMERRLKES
jgi:nucleolar protein 56